MTKLKVGVFGAARGQTMISVLANHPDAELVAVCDKYRPALDSLGWAAEQQGTPIALYEDFEEFFKHDMDAVVLANYANEHATFAVRLLRSGRHVLSEVLPCETMAQAVELIEAVEESGKVYAYAENYCYMPGPFEMWRRYENGDIGEIQYAEGEYVHDCSSIWTWITYGEKNHWRNRAYSTFYCTHSIGPMLNICGRRPVQVVGFETNLNTTYGPTSSLCGGSGAIEMLTLDNGAICKSVHGGLKREPGSINYEIYGTRGMMETDRLRDGEMMIWQEKSAPCEGEKNVYSPQLPDIVPDGTNASGHGGSDFFPTHFFLQKILGRPDGMKYSIDVYKAVDMGICGILAYRSILNGNIPIKVPNLRNKEERDAYRNDNACTNPAVAGDQLLPINKDGDPDIPDEVFDHVRQLWKDNKPFDGFHIEK